MGLLFSQDRLQDTVHRTTAPVSGPNLFPTVSKSAVGRRSCQPPSKRGSGGKSRVLFTDFPCSKKEWNVRLIIDLSTLLDHRHYIMYLITSLGLIINYQKSDLIPTQIFTFIGMEFLTYSNIVRVPHPRVQKLLETIMIIYQKTFISARVFLSLLGQLSAAADFVMLGRLHLRPLQMSLLSQWRPQKFSLNHQIKISANILHHLDWWKQEEIYQQGVPLRINPPSHTIFTDASLSGWGSHVEPEGLLFHGVWMETQS